MTCGSDSKTRLATVCVFLITRSHISFCSEFLGEGAKVKAYVFFKGRSILFKEQGEVLLLRFANDLEEYGKLEQMPVLEGKRMTIMLSPKKSSSSAKQASTKATGTTPPSKPAEMASKEQSV